MEKPIVEIDCYRCKIYKTNAGGYRFIFLNAVEKGGDTEVCIEKSWTMRLIPEKNHKVN